MRNITKLLLVAIASHLATISVASESVAPGLEVLLKQQKALIAGKRVGLITNHSAVDRQMRSAIDLLAGAPGIKLAALFAPEHGVRGAAQAGDSIETSVDTKTGIPIYSLYGKTTRPTPEMLKGIDVLVFDIQDVGVRFYTYINTLGACMESAAEQGIPFIVLDRPNPLADTATEGQILDVARFKSGVGAYPIPIRYGLTIGELSGFINDGLKKRANLTVVKMNNYRRSLWYDQTGLQWIAPSPNIPSLATAIVYPGMCLIEGTNVSEGRGTTQPFEMIGAPWIDGDKLADQLNALKLPGVLFRPASFTPTFSKYKEKECRGIQVHVTDRQRFQAVRVAVYVLATIKKNYPDQFQWSRMIDLLSGSDSLRLAIDRNTPVDDILASWAPDLKKFDIARQRYFLYPQ